MEATNPASDNFLHVEVAHGDCRTAIVELAAADPKFVVNGVHPLAMQYSDKLSNCLIFVRAVLVASTMGSEDQRRGPIDARKQPGWGQMVTGHVMMRAAVLAAKVAEGKLLHAP
jgi:hypothetical protein